MPPAGLSSSDETAAFVLRQAERGDLAAISQLVADTMRISNAVDYPPETIERILIDFTPEALAASYPHRIIWVALRGAVILGTASLEGSRVHAFFIAPQAQGRGCGTALFERTRNAGAQQRRNRPLRALFFNRPWLLSTARLCRRPRRNDQWDSDGLDGKAACRS